MLCRFVPLVFNMFLSPSEGLQASAVDVVTEMVSKRMEPVPKLNLVQQLNIAPICARWQNVLPGAPRLYDHLRTCIGQIRAASGLAMCPCTGHGLCTPHPAPPLDPIGILICR